MADFLSLQQSMSSPTFDFETWFQLELNALLNFKMACPCPGCHESGCRSFNELFSKEQRGWLLAELIQRLNAETPLGTRSDRGLEVVMLLSNWQYWQDTKFHIYSPLFIRALRKELDVLSGLRTQLDAFCSPLKYFEKSKELGVSVEVLDHYLSTCAALVPESHLTSRGEKTRRPRNKTKPVVDLSQDFAERWRLYLGSGEVRLIHHYFDLSADYENLASEIIRHTDRMAILSQFPTGRGYLKWRRLRKKLEAYSGGLR